MSFGQCEQCNWESTARQVCGGLLVCDRCFGWWCRGYGAAMRDGLPDELDAAVYPSPEAWAAEVADRKRES